MIVLGLVFLGYLMGSFPTSYIIARRARGVDLREWGSGNLGATNLYRAAGAGYASIAMVVDVAKGFVPTWLFPQIDDLAVPQLAIAYGAAAVLGHVFSVWVRFRGGKGIATGAGLYLALAPTAVGLALAVWVAVVFVARIVSVGSLLVAALLPFLVWITGHGFDFVFWASLPLAVLVWWTHRSNIRRLLRGREPRIARYLKASAFEEETGSDGSLNQA